MGVGRCMAVLRLYRRATDLAAFGVGMDRSPRWEYHLTVGSIPGQGLPLTRRIG